MGSNIDNRAAAIEKLRTAAEIEHSLLVQYLYAAWSLRVIPPFRGARVPTAPEQRTPAWRGALLAIAQQEMGHFITLQNLLQLVGGPSYLGREHLPYDSDHYPFPFMLEPLSRASLAKYLAAEMPHGLPSTLLPDDAAEIRRLTQKEGLHVNRVGVLFEELLALFGKMREDDFAPPSEAARRQARWAEWHADDPGSFAVTRSARGRVTMVQAGTMILQPTTRDAGIEALEMIAVQGEGGHGGILGGPGSHFALLYGIWRGADFPDDDPDDPAWYPTLPVPEHPNTGPHGPGPLAVRAGEGFDPGRIEHPVALPTARLFNLRYQLLLLDIAHSLALPFGDAYRGLLVRWALSEMHHLANLAARLTQLPRKVGRKVGAEEDPDEVAGPPFEIPDSLELPGEPRERWVLHRALQQQSLELIRSIREAAAREDLHKRLEAFDRDQVAPVLDAAEAAFPGGETA